MKRRIASLSAILFAVLAVPTPARAQGGPPMVTDDPGTPGNRHLEVNIAGIYSGTNENTLVQAPYVDLNYGWGEHVQLKLETGWGSLKQNAVPLRSGAGSALVGVKWRFVDEEASGVAVSTYPQFEFHHFLTSTDPDLAEPGSSLLLPIELSKAFGKFAVNPEFGLLRESESSNQWVYGTVLAYQANKSVELLFEVHGNTRVDGTGTRLLLNAGTRYGLSEKMNLLFSIGHTVTHFDSESTELDTYLGTQLNL